MLRTALSLICGLTMLAANAQRNKKQPATYTPITGVRTEEVLPMAAYVLKTHYKGDIDYLAWGDRHMRSYWISYFWGLGTQCRLKANYRVDDAHDHRSEHPCRDEPAFGVILLDEFKRQSEKKAGCYKQECNFVKITKWLDEIPGEGVGLIP